MNVLTIPHYHTPAKSCWGNGATSLNPTTMKISIYTNVVHIDEDKVLVIPQGMKIEDLRAKLKSEPLVVSDRQTASGRFYVNFAPTVFEGDVKFITLDEIKALDL